MKKTAEEELPVNLIIFNKARNFDYAEFCEWFNHIRYNLELYTPASMNSDTKKDDLLKLYKELNELWKPQDEPFFFSQKEQDLMHKIFELENKKR